jgi:hypothetical protein
MLHNCSLGIDFHYHLLSTTELKSKYSIKILIFLAILFRDRTRKIYQNVKGTATGQ